MSAHPRWVFVFTLITSTCLTAQPGHWDNDRVLFGYVGQERQPAITANGDLLQAWCRLDNDSILQAYSGNNGLTWPELGIPSIETGPDNLVMSSATDNERSFLFCFDQAAREFKLHTYWHDTSGFERQELSVCTLGADTTLHSIAIETDYQFSPDDPFVDMAWLLQAGEDAILRYAQSRDHGFSLELLETVSISPALSPRSKAVSLAATWEDEEETVWLALTQERENSGAEQVTLLPVDQGTPGEPVRVDWNGYPQLQVDIAAYGQTIIVVYTRRINAAGQKDLFFCYSPDGGSTFSEPEPLTGTALDENHPQVVIHPAADRFAVFYLSGEYQQDDATLWVREGVLSTPWLPGTATQISSDGAVKLSGNYDATATEPGFAVAWCGSGLGGDLDIWFDAAERLTPISTPPRAVPAEFSIGSPYPNPFNSTTTLPLHVNRAGAYTFAVTDILGRHVETIHTGYLSVGTNEIPVNMNGHSCGTYFLHDPGGKIVKAIYLK